MALVITKFQVLVGCTMSLVIIKTQVSIRPT
jgi:hypothetical protein